MRFQAKKPVFRAAMQPDGTLELLVYEEIGENYWTGGGVTAKTVKQQIDQAGPHTRLSVRINSPGGDAFEGVAIHNLLRAQKKPVDTFVDGIAASAASIVAMAGDNITMGNNAMMMIHNAWCSCTGYADDMRKMADTLDKVSASIAQTYIDRSGMSADDVKQLMDAESWLGAQECVDKGLATAIAENDENDDAAMALASKFPSLKRLHNVPRKLKTDKWNWGAQNDSAADEACDCYCAPCQDGRCNECECRGCDAGNCAAQNCNCSHPATGDGDGAADASSDLSAFEAQLQMLTL